MTYTFTVQGVTVEFYHSLCRLEQQPVYATDLSSQSFLSWAAGGPAYVAGEDDEWLTMVNQVTADGGHIRRIRVIEDPMTPYQQWLITASAPMAQAGEEIMYLTRLQAYKERFGPEAGDWWLVDSDYLVMFSFGELHRSDGASVVTNPAAVANAMDLFSRVWHSNTGAALAR